MSEGAAAIPSKPLRTVAGLLLGTCGIVALLLSGRPFLALSLFLDRVFGAPPAWTQVADLVRDGRIQELSRGEQPAKSLGLLADYWRGKSGKRVCFIGNSQMQAISLAPGEPAPTAPEPTYVDRLALEAMPNRLLVYRLSAPGMSYAEALWYVQYLLLNPEIRPDQIVLQVNYQSFWNAGVRAGMHILLENERFRQTIEREAADGEAHAESFRVALQEWRESRSKAQSNRKTEETLSFGERLESRTRVALDNAFTPFGERRVQKDDFLELLYRMRVYFMHLKPSTSRTISGTRWERSKSALTKMATLCREQNVRLLLFHAPLNPRVQLYRSQTERARYRELVTRLAAEQGAQLVDLESALEDRYWGRWMNFPDPLHLGREGHRLLAQRFASLILPAPGPSDQSIARQ